MSFLVLIFSNELYISFSICELEMLRLLLGIQVFPAKGELVTVPWQFTY
jgi:hypothetical protein